MSTDKMWEEAEAWEDGATDIVASEKYVLIKKAAINLSLEFWWLDDLKSSHRAAIEKEIIRMRLSK